MKYIQIAAIVLVTGILASCDNAKENKAAQSPGTNPELMQSYTPGQATTDSTAPAINPVSASPSAAPASAPQAATATTAAGMNPPHGQPNHRCDIPVGAPLSSPPGKAPATQPQAAQPVTIQQPKAPAQPAVTTTAPGMNPPHGQPGHRCEIAVGAPLNSAPVKKQETLNPPPANTTITEPVKTP